LEEGFEHIEEVKFNAIDI